MTERYYTELSFNGNETFVMDDENDGETVCVFVRKNHVQEAEEFAAMKNYGPKMDWFMLALVGACALVVALGIWFSEYKP